MNRLEQLKRMTRVVADTGDPEAIRKYQPLDATTNPSLLLKAATIRGYEPLLADAVEWSTRHPGGDRMERCIEKLSVGIGCEILQHIPGSVSTEVSARLSFDEDEIVACAERISRLYNDAGIGNDRVLVKVASTWQGIRAAARLESQGIHCNLTLLFGFAQAVACAEAGVTLVSPFVGRIYDWYKAKTGQDNFAPDEDPGVQSVRRIFNYYKTYGYDTIVMGASFRKAEQIVALAGCDQLTISPPLLEELAASEQPLALALDPSNPGGADEKLSLDEAEFHWHMNEDAMATEKLAEGIRNFYADELRLRDYLASRF